MKDKLARLEMITENDFAQNLIRSEGMVSSGDDLRSVELIRLST